MELDGSLLVDARSRFPAVSSLLFALLIFFTVGGVQYGFQSLSTEGEAEVNDTKMSNPWPIGAGYEFCGPDDHGTCASCCLVSVLQVIHSQHIRLI